MDNMKYKKYILTILICLICGIAITFISSKLLGEPPHERAYAVIPQHQPPQKTSLDSLLEDTISIILESGFAGAITLLLGLYIVRTDKLNRKEHADNFKRFTDLSTESNIQLSAINTRLENLEREAEQQKSLNTMQMLQSKT
tara:strand:- start:353 stop:778 length:426 start_codon:yes stop_codon:yes gene_type:complete